MSDLMQGVGAKSKAGQYVYPPSPLSQPAGTPVDPDEMTDMMGNRIAHEMHNNAISAGGYSTQQQTRNAGMPFNGDLVRSPIIGGFAGIGKKK